MHVSKEKISYIFFAVLVVSVTHVLFSKFGFNPTDEGFILHISNCILHGQIPHVDFVSIRPIGSSILHIPELFFNNHLYLFTRFIFWLEQMLIAIFWYEFLKRQLKFENNYIIKYCIIILIYIFNIHYFPAMAIHTVDAILCSVFGLFIISLDKNYSLLGYLFIGYATLCKQNFLLLIPITIFLFGNKNYILKLVFSMLPICIYLLVLFVNDGLDDFYNQINSHVNLFEVGVFSYLKNYTIYIAAVAYLIGKNENNKHILIIIFIILIYIILLTTEHYTGKYSFLVFGVLFIELISNRNDLKKGKVIFTTMLIAWSVSISIGYHTPALFVGSCIATIFALHYNILHKHINIVLFLCLISITSFIYVRYYIIYREKSVTEINYKLDTIVDGANGIYTNNNTYQVLSELKQLKQQYNNLEIVPDFTACNINHAYQSAIKINWANKTETTNPKVIEMLTNKIMQEEKQIIFAIPKYQTAWLADGFVPQIDEGKQYPLVAFILNNFEKIEEKRYFILYQKNKNPQLK